MIFEAMIVDDEAPARVELINQLERTGRIHVVSEAVCLQEGIAKLRRGGVDVVFVDHNIAGAGTTMLPDVLPELPKIPLFIYMTAYSYVMDDPFGMEPLGFLVKPVDDAKLDEMVALIEESYWQGVRPR